MAIPSPDKYGKPTQTRDIDEFRRPSITINRKVIGVVSFSCNHRLAKCRGDSCCGFHS